MTEEELKALIAKSVERYAALSPEEKVAHDEAQRRSWARGMAPCEHGIADWEDCRDCRSPPSAPPQK